MLDCLIIGGGPAGLSAALVLGRCGRRIAIVDAGRRRNYAAREMHNYLTRDGIAPADFLAHAKAELEGYGVAVHQDQAIAAVRLDDGSFEVKLESGGVHRTRKVLLATGVRDELPALEGFDRLYGVSVHHCPYCDGYEHRGERLAAYGLGKAAVGLGLALLTWSADVVACTDGGELSAAERERARRNGIALREEKVVELAGEGGRLKQVVFESGAPLERDALFFNTGQVQRSKLPGTLGCAFREDGGVKTDNKQCTGVRGVYLAGDADKDVQFVIVAAAEGATAGVAINRELQDEDRA